MPQMLTILSSNTAQAIILLAVLLIVSATAWYLVSRFRDQIKDDMVTSELLTDFREMHHRGDLSQAEYRTIKARLADELQDQVSEDSKTS